MTEELVLKKYITWEWNFAYGPEYCFNNSFDINGLNCTCSLIVKEGIITECDLKGFEGADNLCISLKGSRHMVEDIDDLIKNEKTIMPGLDVFNFF